MPEPPLPDIDPADFIKLCRTVDDRRLVQGVHELGTAGVLERVFAGMADAVDPPTVRGLTALVQFVVKDDTTDYAYAFDIVDGDVRLVPGRPAKPRVTLTMDLPRFLRLVDGSADPMRLVLRGKLRISGDIAFAPRVAALFARPEPD